MAEPVGDAARALAHLRDDVACGGSEMEGEARLSVEDARALLAHLDALQDAPSLREQVAQLQHALRLMATAAPWCETGCGRYATRGYPADNPHSWRCDTHAKTGFVDQPYADAVRLLETLPP